MTMRPHDNQCDIGVKGQGQIYFDLISCTVKPTTFTMFDDEGCSCFGIIIAYSVLITNITRNKFKFVQINMNHPLYLKVEVLMAATCGYSFVYYCSRFAD